jgi:hypothetical protein
MEESGENGVKRVDSPRFATAYRKSEVMATSDDSKEPIATVIHG